MVGTLTLMRGDVIARLADIPDESVHCVVTSPPYWGLRDYGVEGQLGLEATPEENVERMVAVFREVRRVLRSDGVCWLNYGDCYASGHSGEDCTPLPRGGSGPRKRRRRRAGGLKPKDLVGMPWRIAFALQADGWWLRSDIIWNKPNPMPESVTDRPTKSHEYVFLLTKSARYFYDAEAVREAGTIPAGTKAAKGSEERSNTPGVNSRPPEYKVYDGQRNLRSVWTIATHPFPGAHFATFPPKLVEPCVKAGTSEKGCCPKCGAPWVRVVEAEAPDGRKAIVTGGKAYDENGKPLMGDNMIDHGVRGSWNSGGHTLKRTTTGWRKSCDCGSTRGDYAPVPCTVLDPFFGSGTTAIVSCGMDRGCIGIELSDDYADMAERRFNKHFGMFAKMTKRESRDV